MSKAVLVSIRPKWCNLIATGRKALELRKSVPKMDMPFKCYIYCTLGNSKDPRELLEIHAPDGKIRKANGTVIGEFVCDFILRHCEMSNADIAERQSMVRREDIWEYAKGREVFGWHISDLVIYDRPKHLSDFGLTRAPQSWCYANDLTGGAP